MSPRQRRIGPFTCGSTRPTACAIPSVWCCSTYWIETPDSLPRPRYLYACTKVFLEAIGQVYAKEYGLTVLVVRLGWCPRDLGQVKEIESLPRFQDVFLSPGDVGRFFAAAAEAADLPRYSIDYATSRFTHKLHYALSETKRLLNWEPQDQWPTGATEG